MYCNVLVIKPFDNTFTYKIKADQVVKIGQIVLVPFGKKNYQLGMVFEIINFLPTKLKDRNIKEIKLVYKNICLNENIIKFINWISNYTLAPKGLVLKLFIVNEKIIEGKILRDDIINNNFSKKIKLNREQDKAFQSINKHLKQNFQPIVLEGVTGSGKTEVYFEAIEKVIKQKKQVLIMLPEISLTPQLEKRFKSRFGFFPDIWHSKISNIKKQKTWHECYSGKTTIIIGARSSLFLPFKNLGLIIVDEEHDISFKQEDNIRYHARDLAIVRAKIENFPIILCSATPSLETYNNIRKKNFLHLYLSNQYSGLELPQIEIINLKNEKFDKNKWISKRIISELKKCVSNNNQALLFLNKRGYSPLTLCKECGYRFKCDFCTSWLVLHRTKERLLCHQCGKIYKIETKCPKCKVEKTFQLIGPGVERLAEEVQRLFPSKKVDIMSSDNTNTTLKLKKVIKNFELKKIDILVATQIMAKGYHFPDLSLVGVIDADSGLLGGDPRANEKTYNLLQQVSGRAGRSKKLGKVLIQSFYPDHPLLLSFKNRDRINFLNKSLEERKIFKIPPFSFMTAIIISSAYKNKAQNFSQKLIKEIPFNNKYSFMGPVEAPIFLLRGKYRYRILFKGDGRQILNNMTRKLLKNSPPPSGVNVLIDVDPYTFV